MGQPSVFPMGVTVYNPDKCFNGYTVVPLVNDGVLLFDMNGNEIRRWKMQSMPPKILPGGHVMGYSGVRHPDYGMQDSVNLIQVDYDGNIEWSFDHWENINDPGRDHRWMARQHHDYQREGQAVYYTPTENPKVDSGTTMILAHRTINNPLISDKRLLDDVIYEVDWEGNIIWQWSILDHFEQLGFTDEALNVMARNPNMREADGGVGDILHTNCASYLGPNKWFDQGDQRFKPNNIIADCREANVLFILDHDTGDIVWRIGPDFMHDPRLKKIGQIIGQHHFHMIPKGLPGEGNVMVFDNGGWGGYGNPNPGSWDGTKNALRDYSRVIEFDPTTLRVVWKCTPAELGHAMPVDASKFYSPYVSSCQRLPNGNTLIDEGSDGRLIEVTPDHEIVWEWISPYFTHVDPGKPSNNMIYRANRYPYEYIPQEPKPQEIAIEPVDNTTFRLPHSGQKGTAPLIEVEGTLPYYASSALCVATVEETDEMEEKREAKLFDAGSEQMPEIDQQAFTNNVINGHKDKPQLVMFGAVRCTHCKVVHPLIEQALTEEYADKIDAYYIDVDKNPGLVSPMRIAGTPVVAIFKDGKEVSRFSGEVDYDGLLDFVDEAIEK
ncbi:MAG: thioredoxin domain-containing protein [Actinomycetaceae bacterium]|nr:thioredoxin domain-containing protein [Actinomycetaceae bacterium]MDY6083375.1 thioredoxin domain-containing protein [Actinomycetaceae bacterium]